MPKQNGNLIIKKYCRKSAVSRHFISQLSKYLLIAGCIASLNVTAGTMGTLQATESHRWSVTASLGDTNYQSMYSDDGQTVLGRLALGRELFAQKQFTFGLELGVQNGNSMRLNVPQATLDELGGLPIQSTVKPMLDLLVTANTLRLGTSEFFGQLKGGIAYRRWQFDDRTSINNLSNMAGEIQAGIGYPISQTTTLSLLYQGIFGGNPDFSVNATSATGSVSTIPIQQGVLLSLSLTV